MEDKKRMVEITIEEYTDLILTKYKLEKIISIIKKDDRTYGLSGETESFIEKLLDIKKENSDE